MNIRGLILFSSLLACNVHATPTYSIFDELPGATFGGTGIPNDAVAQTFVADESTLITLGLTATQRFSNPPLSNDGMGTFQATPGSNQGNPDPPPDPSPDLGATWNFGFYINIANGVFGDYLFTLLYDFDPAFNTPDGSLGILLLDNFLDPMGTLAEDSQNLLFPFFAANVCCIPPEPPNATFDPNATGEYSLVLLVQNQQEDVLGRVAIDVVVSAESVSSVPEPNSLALSALPLAVLGWLHCKGRGIRRSEVL